MANTKPITATGMNPGSGPVPEHDHADQRRHHGLADDDRRGDRGHGIALDGGRVDQEGDEPGEEHRVRGRVPTRLPNDRSVSTRAPSATTPNPKPDTRPSTTEANRALDRPTANPMTVMTTAEISSAQRTACTDRRDAFRTGGEREQHQAAAYAGDGGPLATGQPRAEHRDRDDGRDGEVARLHRLDDEDGEVAQRDELGGERDHVEHEAGQERALFANRANRRASMPSVSCSLRAEDACSTDATP